MSDPIDPKRPHPSAPGTALGPDADADADADALLDSLLFDDSHPVPLPQRPSISLHHPAKREYSEDEVTLVGRSEALLASLAAATADDDGTSGLEELAGSDIDQLLSSIPASMGEAEARPGEVLSLPRLPAVPPAPRVPAVPRPGSRMPSIPGFSQEPTARPPAINPAGPPSRQPFPPAVSPRAPITRDLAAKLLLPQPGLFEDGEPVLIAPPAQSVRPSHPESEPERTHIYRGQVGPGVEASEPDVLPDPFLAPEPGSTVAHSSFPALEVLDPKGHLPTLAVPGPDRPAAMPKIPGPQRLPELSSPSQAFERQPSDPADAMPVSVRPSSPPSIWPDERPAQDHLAAQRDAWVTRAEWFENEARATDDAPKKARLLIVASELWALVGDLPHAREVATEASSLPRTPFIASRQMRALAAADGDFRSVAPALEMESRSAATADARVHAAYLSAQLHRLSLHDDQSAKKKLELAVRLEPDDPRAYVEKLAELLGKSNAPARVRFPESEALSDLSRASDELLWLRGAPAPAVGAHTTGPRSAFDDARRALSNGDREKAADALDRLASVDGLGHACAWLSACLLSADPKTRGRASRVLSELAADLGSRLARRALVTRALEQGDAEGVRQAIAGSQGQETFSASDRLALSALIDLSADTLESTVWEVARDPELRPLAAAFVAATPSLALDLLVGSEASRAQQKLGRTLGSAPDDTTGLSYLRADADAFETTHPDSALSRFLALEFAKVLHAKGSLAVGLSEWPLTSDAPEVERDHRLAAALVHELAGEPNSAAVMYRRAFELDATSDAALRAISHAAPAQTADLLTLLADQLGATARAAISLLEAALRQGPDDRSGYLALLERAKIAAPELLLGYRLAEIAARQTGDTPALLATLRARRQAAQDPIEQAFDLVREALLVAETDLPLAGELLEEAISARPSDLALRELSERVVPTSDEQRAAWRESLAPGLDGPERGRLLAEAALEREHAGDHEAAARNAYSAVESGGTALWRVVAERYASSGPARARLSEVLLDRARTSDDPTQRRQIYERLSQIDEARGDSSSALLWQAAILEQSALHLPALRRLEHAYISGDRAEELEPIAVSLARVLDVGESNAHARLVARFRVRRGAWSEAREMAEISVEHAPTELWALRALSAHARAAEDSELGLRVDERLFELATRPLDQATLALRAAEAAARQGRRPDTLRLLGAALDRVPGHLLALTTLAEVLEEGEEYVAAAEALETSARASQVTAHQVSAWHQAAVLWLDKAANPERGRAALERAALLDVSHEDAVVRLQALYVAANERQKLSALLERRLASTSDPEERIAIEVTRGRALAEVGERDAAKAALAAALDANPDHAEALEAFAELCLAEGDWASAEQALIRLVRHVIELPRQAQIYRRLGELYDTALPNPERAELAYNEVLKRDPNDSETVARLVQVYGRLGDKVTALSLQTDLLARATSADEKRERTLALALVEEQIAFDRKGAERTLERARKEWPHDSVVLRALAEFHVRHGESRAAQVLLDRAAADARRALGTGRFEPGFFEVLATVAEFRNAGDAALVAHATLAALHGQEVSVPAAGPVAGDPRLDDLLAPELVSLALRSLLRKSGQILDAAYVVDLRPLRLSPLAETSPAFTSYVQQVAASFGLHGLVVSTSPSLGLVCMPISSGSPQVVFGQGLLDSDDDAARYFLLIRCLKILQANAAALSRTPPIDLWPVLAAYLSVFAPNWLPQGVDAKKLSDAQQRIQGAMQGPVDDDVPALALQVIGAIGNRASLLATALHQWGNRTALLSAGSLVASLRGVAFASGLSAGPPKEGPERVKWIVRNPEARDLATFGVSEQYAEARARLGLNR